ncbi:lambda phage type II DNA modification methyltransferase [Streptomyces hygroscopicus subsp. sporocinereus]|uniref:Lambda phage type II DNA modification methyltransferase n=1 Tax=Streptomyces hygroscopicus TaxID=1912 RepID=A0ABQ3UF88_STRHY|nr:methyltransferase [Streptomyces hygroscopicus]GHJ34269.1 lambda phage type II DNA modification methyltransferase [Streptomyces hygroscopicus]
MKVTTDVLAVLDRAETDGNVLRLTSQLDRKLYVATNKVLELAGGKWNRKARAHLFEGDAADAIEQVILTGQIVNKKQQFGYFPTPASVVEQLINLADLSPGMDVLEPSAGRGAIALPIAKLGVFVECVELQEDNARHILDADAPGILGVTIGDFLTCDSNPEFDRIVMNPPFARQSDIRHVLHALDFLKPGGLLVAVMSAGVTFRSGRAEKFRNLVADRGGSIDPLPEGAFKESGTDVRTVIAVIPAPAASD